MKPRVLMLTHRVPYPPNRGDRIRSWQILKHLSTFSDVYLGATADEPVEASTRQVLEAHCKSVAIMPTGRIARWGRAALAMARGHALSEGLFQHAQLARQIAVWQSECQFDAAVVYCSAMFPYVAGATWRNVPCLVDFIDVDSQKWRDYAAKQRGWKSWLYAHEARAIGQLEQRIVEMVDRIVLTTPAEARLLRDNCPDAQPHVMRNGIDHSFLVAEESAPSIKGRVTFVGALDYLPNIDGIAWFVDHVWPLVRAAIPDATLDIVGRQPTSRVKQLARTPGISIHANVPDVRPHLRDAEVVVSPLRIARGVQNKVLEAMAMRRAVIASPEVCRGLDAVSGEHLCSASGTEAWLTAVVELLQNSDRRYALAASGHNYVREHHDWEQCLAPLRQWIKSLTPPSLMATNSDIASPACELVPNP